MPSDVSASIQNQNLETHISESFAMFTSAWAMHVQATTFSECKHVYMRISSLRLQNSCYAGF